MVEGFDVVSAHRRPEQRPKELQRGSRASNRGVSPGRRVILHAQDRFVGQSPVAYTLNEADKRNLDYTLGSSGDTLRLYTTNSDAGFGSRGRTDTYVDVNTNLLADDKAASLWLLCSVNALRDEGTLHDIME